MFSNANFTAKVSLFQKQNVTAFKDFNKFCKQSNMGKILVKVTFLKLIANPYDTVHKNCQLLCVGIAQTIVRWVGNRKAARFSN